MIRPRFTAFVALATTLTLLLISLAAAPVPCRAQQTTSVGSLYLSSGSELDFRLFGANGGAGTNGTNSDRIASSSVFNYSSSSSSAGNYIVGFSHGDNNPLLPGSLYTLVTFSSTNFTAADATRFTAAPRGNVSSISGNFILNPGTGGTKGSGGSGSGGTLQFQLTGEAELPEPGSRDLLFLACGAMGVMMGAVGRREREKSDDHENSGERNAPHLLAGSAIFAQATERLPAVSFLCYSNRRKIPATLRSSLPLGIRHLTGAIDREESLARQNTLAEFASFTVFVARYARFDERRPSPSPRRGARRRRVVCSRHADRRAGADGRRPDRL